MSKNIPLTEDNDIQVISFFNENGKELDQLLQEIFKTEISSINNVDTCPTARYNNSQGR